jgi:hypothetical protein
MSNEAPNIRQKKIQLAQCGSQRIMKIDNKSVIKRRPNADHCASADVSPADEPQSHSSRASPKPF